jgi:hypothetical protein
VSFVVIPSVARSGVGTPVESTGLLKPENLLFAKCEEPLAALAFSQQSQPVTLVFGLFHTKMAFVASLPTSAHRLTPLALRACTERSAPFAPRMVLRGECALLAPSGVEGSLANVSAASPSEVRPVGVLEAAAKDLQNPPFLIATRVHSPEKSTRCKIRAISFPNRHKIHFVSGEPNLPLVTRIVVRYYPVRRLEGT